MNILIAEDDLTTRLVLQKTLKRLGHEVTAVANGKQAWENLQTAAFPVVISDWMMPNWDGLSLCRAIRSQNTSHYTVVLLLTSRGGKANYLEAMNAGADDFLTKPFDEHQLAARLVVAERILGLRTHVKRLEGLLPICSYCKRIRDRHSGWSQIEEYVSQRTEAQFSHGICPECAEKFLANISTENFGKSSGLRTHAERA